MYSSGNLELDFEDGLPMVMIWGGGKVIYIGGVPQIDDLIRHLKIMRKKIIERADRQKRLEVAPNGYVREIKQSEAPNV